MDMSADLNCGSSKAIVVWKGQGRWFDLFGANSIVSKRLSRTLVFAIVPSCLPTVWTRLIMQL